MGDGNCALPGMLLGHLLLRLCWARIPRGVWRFTVEQSGVGLACCVMHSVYTLRAVICYSPSGLVGSHISVPCFVCCCSWECVCTPQGALQLLLHLPHLLVVPPYLVDTLVSLLTATCGATCTLCDSGVYQPDVCVCQACFLRTTPVKSMLPCFVVFPGFKLWPFKQLGRDLDGVQDASGMLSVTGLCYN
jgi:hypothetical protein